MRKHHAFWQSRSAAGVGKRGYDFACVANGLRQGRSCRLEQRTERLRAAGVLARGVDAAQLRQAAKIHIVNQRAISYEQDCARVFELIPHLALAIAWI